MCLFKKKPQPITGSKVALLFGINRYGGGNDLQGCLNDIDDVEKKLKAEFPDFQIRKFKDSEVTTERFISEIENVYNTIQLPGVCYLHYSGHGTQLPNIKEVDKYDEALYLVNGPLVDDNIWVLQQKTPLGLFVVAKFDSCFSGGMNKGLKTKSRFMPLPGMRVMAKSVRRFNKTVSEQWVIFSGSSENQTSADAWFNNRPNGAFTYFDLKSFNPSSTYTDEITKLKTFLPSSNFDQKPALFGNTELFERKVLT